MLPFPIAYRHTVSKFTQNLSAFLLVYSVSIKVIAKKKKKNNEIFFLQRERTRHVNTRVSNIEAIGIKDPLGEWLGSSSEPVYYSFTSVLYGC